jgi:hypothetical protein
MLRREISSLIHFVSSVGEGPAKPAGPVKTIEADKMIMNNRILQMRFRRLRGDGLIGVELNCI